MRKSVILIKRLVALLLVLLLSIESFGAVVSDNDGSAFITKAEFDSLKNDFQAQIDQYNTSIDMKIDGAIAAYLAGIKTVASETSKVLVDNYSDMMWVRNYDVYGRWKKWTNNTTYTSNTTSSWFTPSLNEKRHSFRANNGQMYSSWNQAYTLISTYLNFDATNGSNGVCVAVTPRWAMEDFSGIPTLTLLMMKNSDGVYLVNKPFNIFAMSPHTMSSIHAINNSNPAAYQWHNYRWRAESITILDKSANDILKFRINARALPSTDTTSYYYIDTLNAANFPFPCTWCDDDHTAGSSADKFDTQTQAYSTSGFTTSNYFTTGCTWHKLDNRSAQISFLRNMMLGQSNTQEVNTAYYIDYFGERGQYDFSKSTTSGTWSGNITQIATLCRYNPVQSDAVTDRVKTVSVSASFSVPHWPTENLRDLTSGVFKYNNTGLKFGEGMPLRIDNQTNGYLQISFDSSVNEILTGSAHSNQNLKIDIRKENFLSSSANWAQGYKGLVNPDSTSETLVELRNYQYTTTDGKIKLTVPMKKDESLWIRIAPWTSDKGYCAKWSNLSMTMNTN